MLPDRERRKEIQKKKKKKKNVGICAKENSMTCLMRMRMRTVAGCDHCHNSQIYRCNTQHV